MVCIWLSLKVNDLSCLCFHICNRGTSPNNRSRSTDNYSYLSLGVFSKAQGVCEQIVGS